MAKIISESQLVIPALVVLSQHRDFISSKTLKEGILNIIKPKKMDLQIIEGRKQTIINSRIDNIISHRTLEGFAEYCKINSKVFLKITKKGKTYLSKEILDNH